MNIVLRQPFSGLSHLAGAFASLFVLLIWLFANPFSTPIFIFMFASILLFSSSALYHLASVSPAQIKRFRLLDHMMIYVFIAACFTPVCLISLRGSYGPTLCGIIWVIALFGVVKKCFWMHAPRWLGVLFYLIMGWSAALTIPTLYRILPTAGLVFLLSQGFFFTMGAFVYVTKWPDPYPDKFGFHEIWHLFVLAGVTCHFILVTQYI